MAFIVDENRPSIARSGSERHSPYSSALDKKGLFAYSQAVSRYLSSINTIPRGPVRRVPVVPEPSRGIQVCSLRVLLVLVMIASAFSVGDSADALAGPEVSAPPQSSVEQGQPATFVGPGETLPDVPRVDEELNTLPSVTAPLPALGQPDTSPENGGIFDSLYGGVSHGFLSSANWLDSFFGDERYVAEVNQSQLKVRFDAFREGSTGVDYRRPNFDLRLVLPQLRKKTRLVISGDPNVDVDATTGQPGSPGATIAHSQERNLTTQLQVVPVETKRSNFSIRAGVKLHNGKLSILAGPRYRYLIPLDPWDLRFTQEFVWSTDMRWQSRTRFDLERSLPSDLFFRTTLEGVWSENVIGYPYSLSLVLRQPLDNNRALQYEWVNSFQTYPTNELIEELLVFRYRQRFIRDWLFLEIAPQYRFPRDMSFHGTPGILFRLEMVFGNIAGIF